MFYFLLLIALLLFIYGISLFIKIPTVENTIFEFFIKQLTVISFLISGFATFLTHGKTIFILFIPILVYLFVKGHIIFSKPLKRPKQDLYSILLIFPIILIQFFLNFDITDLQLYVPSSDIIQYASYANGLVQYGSENKFEALNVLYPELFNGMSPYHYYEIWFTSLIGSVCKLSFVFTLQLIVYPYLIWLFVLGIASTFEHYQTKLSLKEYGLCFLLLFIGPVYLSVYEQLFNDGEFFQSTVFTVTGFLKQTLSFSYFGQKHLPVSVFGILLFLFILKKQIKPALLVGFLAVVCSFGTLPGIFGSFGFLFVLQKKYRSKENFLLLSGLSLLVILVISLNKMGIDPEVAKKTFYFGEFLKELNLKGEIMRVITKVIGPFLWLSILYFPFILLFTYYRKRLLESSEIRTSLYLSGFLFMTGSLFISTVQGLNSDQFLTNLVPLFNCILIISCICLYHSFSNKKIMYLVLLSIFLVNSSFIIGFYKMSNQKAESYYSLATISKVKKELDLETNKPVIAYLLNDHIVQTKPVSNWYPAKPGKLLSLSNYFNLVNIDYPYIKYEKNSSSIAFCPENQMRFFLNDKFVPKDDFDKIQIDFLERNSIKWLFVAKGAIIAPEIKKLIETYYIDKMSGEMYCKLRRRI